MSPGVSTFREQHEQRGLRTMRQLIFVIDEVESGRAAQECLEAAGYEVQTFSTSEVITEAEIDRPALMLISLFLPDGIGIGLCRRIRENPVLTRTPVLFLLADATEEHRILALESGADDCIVKPFSPRELVARVQAVLRRFSPESSASDTQSSDFVIDSSAMRLSVRGAEVPTTSLEFRLIEYLAQHRGQVFTRDLLLDAVWGDMQFVTPRSVDACIRRVREKIEPDRSRPIYLKTIRGVGYRLDATPIWRSSPNESCDCAVCSRSAGSVRMTPASAAKRRASSVPARG